MSTCYDCGQNECRCERPASLPDVLAAVTLGPEDRLVIVLPEFVDFETRKQSAEMADRFAPGRVMVLAGIESVSVLRATKAEGSTVGQCGDSVTLLTLPVQVQSCHLAYGHTGMHSDGEATWSNEPARAPRCGARRVVMEGPSQRQTGSWWCVLPQGHHGNHYENGTEWSDPS